MNKKESSKAMQEWIVSRARSLARLRHVLQRENQDLWKVYVDERDLLLETVCLFIHTAYQEQKFNLPASFFKELDADFGIYVWPSALKLNFVKKQPGLKESFTSLYVGHIELRDMPTHPNIGPPWTLEGFEWTEYPGIIPLQTLLPMSEP